MGAVDYYYIQRASGTVTGPFPFAKIEAMRRQGRLAETDKISTDKLHWASLNFDASTACESVALPDAPPEIQPAEQPNARPGENQAPPILKPIENNRIQLKPLDDGQPRMPPVPPWEEMLEKPCPKRQMSPSVDDVSASTAREPDASAQCAMLFASVWQGHLYFRDLEWNPTAVCAFAQIYALAVSVGCWLMTPPAAAFCGRRWLDIAAVSAAAWLATAILGWLAVMLCCLGSWRHLAPGCSSKTAAWLAQIRYATLLGVVLMFRNIMLGDSPWRILPWCVAGALFLLNEVNQWRILHDYARRTLESSDAGWGAGAMLATLLWLGTLCAVFCLSTRGLI